MACLIGALVIALIAFGFTLDVIGRGALQRRTSTVESITYHPAYKGPPWIELDLDGDSQPYIVQYQLPGGLPVSQVHADDRIDLWYTDSVIGGREVVAIRLYAGSLPSRTYGDASQRDATTARNADLILAGFCFLVAAAFGVLCFKLPRIVERHPHLERWLDFPQPKRHHKRR